MGRERDGERAANERKRTGERRMTGERERERDAHRLPLAISGFYRTPRLNVDAEMVELKTAHTDTQPVRERGRENEREREMQRNKERYLKWELFRMYPKRIHHQNLA